MTRNFARPAALLTIAAALALNAPAALAAEPAGASRGESVGATPREVQTAVVLSPDPARRQFERMSEFEIKRYYRTCGDEAVERRIGRGDIMACSIAYDVLLTRHFGGDFMALLTWTQAQGNKPSE